jgi:polar amino acid transport system substrate-binding protein
MLYKLAIWACVLWAAAMPARGADRLRLMGGDISFFCNSGPDGKASGLACDVMAEMARRVGHSGRIEIYPFARALMVASTTPGVLLAPVGRIPGREKLYQWHLPIVEDDFVAVALRDSAADISSLAALHLAAVGVVRDSVGARLAEESGMPGVSLVTTDDTNARKLRAGRIDAWISSWNGIRSAWRLAGYPAGELRRGVVLARVKIYLVSSRDTDPALVAPWKAAFEDMRRDGSYDAILRRYQFELPR